MGGGGNARIIGRKKGGAAGSRSVGNLGAAAATQLASVGSRACMAMQPRAVDTLDRRAGTHTIRGC